MSTHPNPGPGNPGPGNPTQSVPGPGNPGPGNPGPGNPGPGNPGPGNAGFGEYTDYTYEVTAPGANTTSQFASFADLAAAAAVDTSHFVQMIIMREHGVPTLAKDPNNPANCVPIERTEDEIISLINAGKTGELGVPGPGNPGPGNPGPGNPGPGNPGPGNTTASNPGPGNPGPGNNTFAVAPANAPLAPLAAGGAAMFRATALASASAMAISNPNANVGPDGTQVGTPKRDKVFVTIRFHHCTRSGGCNGFNGRNYAQETVATETVPKAPGGGAENLIVFAVHPAPGDNDAGVITIPRPVGRGANLTVSAPEVLATTPTQGTAGSQTTVGAFTISNVGDADAGPFSYRYFLVPAEGTPVALTDSIPVSTGETGISIAADTSRDFGPQDVTIPLATPPGNYRIVVFVDDTNTTAETNEADNLKDATFTVADTARIAVWADNESTDGGNGIVGFINNTMPGFSATVVSTADLETAGFLNTFNALYITRFGSNIPGASLSATAAANVQSYVGAGPAVAFMNDWDDNLSGSASGDPEDLNTSQLIANAVRRAASRHGYVGEYNGAAMALTGNTDGFVPLGFIGGTAGLLGSTTCRPVTVLPAGSPIQGTVPTDFTPTDPTCFGSAATSVAAGNIWVVYNNIEGPPGPPAVIGR